MARLAAGVSTVTAAVDQVHNPTVSMGGGSTVGTEYDDVYSDTYYAGTRIVQVHTPTAAIGGTATVAASLTAVEADTNPLGVLISGVAVVTATEHHLNDLVAIPAGVGNVVTVPLHNAAPNDTAVAIGGTATVTFNLFNTAGNVLAAAISGVATVVPNLRNVAITPIGPDTLAGVATVTAALLNEGIEGTGFFNSDVTVTVEVAWPDFPLATSPTWTDITTDVRGFRISRGRSNYLDEYGPGTLNLTLDNNLGDYDPTNAAGTYWPNVKPMKQIRITAFHLNVEYPMFRGYVESWPLTVWDKTDETTEVTAVDGFKVFNLIKDSTGQSQEAAGTRIGNLLDEANWPATMRTLDTGVATILAYTPECETTLDLIRTVEASEAGQFFVGANGNATFFDRNHRGSLSSVATFGDSTSTEIPYQDIFTDYDDTQIWNQIVVSVSGFPSQADSTGSQDNYGVRTLPFNDILLTSIPQGDLLAAEYLSRYEDPIERIEWILLKPILDPTRMWPQALGRELSDKVTVNYRTNAGNLKSAPSFIERIIHDVVITSRRWETTWNLSQFE